MNLPIGWRLQQLEEISERMMVGIASSATHAYRSEGVVLLRNQNIKENKIDTRDILYIDPIYEKQHHNKRLKTGDVLTVRTGYAGVSAVVSPEFNGAQCFTSLITRPNLEVIDSHYLSYYINSDAGKKFIIASEAGGAQKNVNVGALSKLLVPLPPLPEQCKIAEILSTWDEAIDLTEQLIAAKQRRKQTLMQRLLIVIREESSPNRRFPAFTEPWQQRQFGEVFERVTRKNTIGNDNVLTISAQRGLISQTHFFNKIVASDSLSGYYLLKHGEFAYNKSYSEGYPYGAFKRLNDYDAGVLSTLYVCFCIKSPTMNSDYFVHFFEAGGMNHGIYSIAQEGARNHGLLNMSVIDLFKLPLLIPSLEEQNALASFFNDLNHEIDLLQQKLAALRQQKQGLMQQLLTGKIRVKV